MLGKCGPLSPHTHVSLKELRVASICTLFSSIRKRMRSKKEAVGEGASLLSRMSLGSGAVRQKTLLRHPTLSQQSGS